MSAVAERQCVVALRKAEVVRMERTAIKRALKQREVLLAEVWDEPAVQTMRIADLLESVPGLAAFKVASILLTLCIGYQRPVGHLSDGQRREILRLIRQRHPWIKAGS